MKKLLRSVFVLSYLLAVNVFALDVVSSNVKWVGYSKNRDNEGIAKLLSLSDVVFIQELVSPPFVGLYPDGRKYKPDTESAAFFKAMIDVGFSFHLSPEDTGKIKKNGNNSSATEWFVVFYKENVVSLVKEGTGFISEDVTANTTYSRVPYITKFRNVETGQDYSFVNVHLPPGKARQKERFLELEGIVDFLDSYDSDSDLFVLGDFNIHDCEGFYEMLAKNGYGALNSECVGTNLKRNKSYDHIIYKWGSVLAGSFSVIEFPEVYNSSLTKEFVAKYSDHYPVSFVISNEKDDD